jgi:hypothetical protein
MAKSIWQKCSMEIEVHNESQLKVEKRQIVSLHRQWSVNRRVGERLFGIRSMATKAHYIGSELQSQAEAFYAKARKVYIAGQTEIKIRESR